MARPSIADGTVREKEPEHPHPHGSPNNCATAMDSEHSAGTARARPEHSERVYSELACSARAAGVLAASLRTPCGTCDHCDERSAGACHKPQRHAGVCTPTRHTPPSSRRPPELQFTVYLWRCGVWHPGGHGTCPPIGATARSPQRMSDAPPPDETEERKERQICGVAVLPDQAEGRGRLDFRVSLLTKLQ